MADIAFGVGSAPAVCFLWQMYFEKYMVGNLYLMVKTTCIKS